MKIVHSVINKLKQASRHLKQSAQDENADKLSCRIDAGEAKI
jgi:hypothetical protein